MKQVLTGQIWQGVVAALLEVVCLALLVLLARERLPAPADEQVKEWVVAQRITWLKPVAVVGSYLGVFPVMLGVIFLVGCWIWAHNRSWRELIVLAWSLLAGEAIGLVLLALIRKQGIEPAHTLAWPHGYAGLAPLRVSGA